MMNTSIPALRILPADSGFAQATQGAGNGASFSDMLEDAVGNVEGLQQQANQKVGAMLGGHSADVHDAMIAVQKADLSFQLMMQVRNKVVAAYQEVEHMQF
jgi:flagellar hook-basal body complex protein FliE